MLQRCQFLFPCYCMRMKKTERTKKAIPVRMPISIFQPTAKCARAKKAVKFPANQNSSSRARRIPRISVFIFPPFNTKTGPAVLPSPVSLNLCFSSEHTQHSPVFRGQRLNRTSCHPAPELFRSVPAQRSLPEPVSLPVRAAV